VRWSGWRRSPRWRRNEHAYVLVQAHGEAGWTGRLVPLTVDGLIYASSMVMLDSALRKTPVPALARWLLGHGQRHAIDGARDVAVRVHHPGSPQVDFRKDWRPWPRHRSIACPGNQTRDTEMSPLPGPVLRPLRGRPLGQLARL
jgi:hypothetical protein